MAPKRRATAKGRSSSSARASRSPSVQPPARAATRPAGEGRAAGPRTVLDAAGGLLIALLVAEAVLGRWLALPQLADIDELLGPVDSRSLPGSNPQQSGGTRMLFGSCNKLSCDAGRFGSKRKTQRKPGGQQAQGTMSVRLEEARLPEQVADSPFPSGQGCVKTAAAAAIWPAILQRAKGADAWLWAGDAVYADVRLSLADALRLDWDRGSAFRLFREGMKPNPFIGATPRRLEGQLSLLKDYGPYEQLRAMLPPNAVFGSFDDHDFGLNDGGASYEHKAAAQNIFLDFLDEPPDSPRRNRAGLYTSHWVGGEGKPTIHLILLDVRYNRSPIDDPDGGDFLGSAQWKWLEKELRFTPPGEMDGATPAATVVLSTLPVVANRFGLGEGWHHFPNQRRRLLRLLAGSGRPGLVLLSGDIHLAELSLLTCGSGDGGGGGLEQFRRIGHDDVSSSARWAVWELTSSGMTHAWDGEGMNAGAPRWARHMRSALSSLLPLPHTVAMFADINFGEVAVDAPGEILTLSVFNAAGAAVISQHIPLKLSAAAGSANASAWTDSELELMECGPWRGSAAVTQLWVKVSAAGGALGFMCCTCCNCAGRLHRRARRVDVREGRRGGSACCGAKF
eukprot:COSAG02_NODE_2076_length_9917_cov_906.312589_7_plen_622_part_00